MKILFALIILLLAAVPCLHAATYTAASVAYADVKTLTDAAVSGDTINVPAGSATWTNELLITKNIYLVGAGSGTNLTMIIDEVQKVSPEKALIRFDSELVGRLRVSGFHFQGGTVRTQETTQGRIRIRGSCRSFRVDRCLFNGLWGTAVGVDGFCLGVIDNNVFHNVESHPVTVDHTDWQPFNGATPTGGLPYTKGNGSWADDPYWGTERFVYIESNSIRSDGEFGIDAFEGARYSFRFNTCTNLAVVNHGTEGQGRSAKQTEEYGNTFLSSGITQAGQLRGGSMVTCSNTYTGYVQGHILRPYRTFTWDDNWRWAGWITNSPFLNPYDDNLTNGVSLYWATGTHTGGMDSNGLTDAAATWTVNQWVVPGAMYILRNVTKYESETEADRPQSFITSSGINTISYSNLDDPNLRFDTGDSYIIYKIAHSLDQPGLGKDDGTMNGFPALPAHYSNTQEMCYSWANTLPLATSHPCVTEGRDFTNGIAKPGWTPYSYPHPLTDSPTAQHRVRKPPKPSRR